MAFSQKNVSDVRAVRDGPEIFVSWTSSAPGRTSFQVYVDRRLAWTGTSQSCYVPAPAGAVGRSAWIEVGTVAPDESITDFSTRLSGPGGTGNRASLSWLGGTYLDATLRDDIRGFRIYGSATAGGPVNYAAPVGVVAAYSGGEITDGFGAGGFAQGGFGRAATSYRWNSGPLGSGTWSFAVVPYDAAGNAQGSPMVVNVVIAAAPRAPVADGNGRRLNFAYAGPATRLATLNWLASPS